MNKIIYFLRESKLARFLIPLGIILIIFGIVFMNSSIKNKDYIKTEATVTNVEVYEEAHRDSNGHDVEATYSVDLKYTVNGKEYNSDLDGVSKYNTGDKMTIYYNPEDPSQITQTKSVIIPMAMIAAGIVAIVGGVLSGMNAVKRYNRMKQQEKEWANGK